jgi:MFS family permease
MDTTGGGDRWLYAWALGSVTAGAASLLVPLYVIQLGGDPVALGVLASSAALIGAPGAIVVGRLADRTGRRRSLLVGAMAGVVAALVVVPVLESVALVVVVNAVLWLVWAAVAPVVTMLAVEAAAASAWNERIGKLNAYQGYGWAGGLLLGTCWTVVGSRVVTPLLAQRTLFVACSLCAVGGLVGIARFLPGEKTDTRNRAETRRIAALLTRSRRHVRSATFAFSPNRLYWTTRAIDPRKLYERTTPALGAYFGAALLFFVGFSVFWAPLPVYLTAVGYDSGAVFALFLAASLGSAVFYAPAGRLSDRYDLRYVQSSALGARALLFPAVVAVGASTVPAGLTLPLGLGLLGLIGVTWGVIAVAGTAIVTRLSTPSLRGETLGVYTALSAVGGGIGGVLGGWLASRGYLLAFAVAGALVVVSAGIVFLLRSLSPGDTAHGES